MGRRGRKSKMHSLRDYLDRGHQSDDGIIGRTRGLIEKSRNGWNHPEQHLVTAPDEPTLKHPSVWTTGESAMSKCATQCSWAEQNKAPETTIHLNEKVGNAIKYLLQNVPVEWQLLLIGRIEENVVFVEDYYIPKQVVGAAHVRNIDCIDKEFISTRSVVGTMHSHVDMMASFSQTDWESCNSSPLKYHVVINKRYEYEAVKQITLACGMFRFNHVGLAFETANMTKPEGFDNISKEDYSSKESTYNSWEANVEPVRYKRGVQLEFPI